MTGTARASDQSRWAASRHGDWPVMRIFAFDHRSQMEEMPSATPARIGAFKELCLQAALRQADAGTGYGILCDGRLGGDALAAATGTGLWIGRPTEWPGSRPLTLEPELGLDCNGLADWPESHVIKCLCFAHPDDDAAMWGQQLATLTTLFQASRRHGLEFLLEVIPSKVGPVDDETTPAVIQRCYDAGLFPDWWKLEPFRTEAAWQAACDAINRNDATTRGIVVLGLDAPMEDLAASFALAARFDLVKGFAVGRTIFGPVARQWFAGACNDATAVSRMADTYARLCALWDAAREKKEVLT